MTSNAHAHGFAGKRFFPATLAIDDSFVNPELDFLYRNDKVRDDSGNAVYLSGLSVEFAQPLARGFALFIGDTYLHQNPAGPGAVQNGFDNVEIGSKYQVFIHDQEESALAVGLNAELGGTGSKHVSASSFTTLSPVIYYSKGLGNLPIQGLRPFAVTAQIAPNFPTSPRDPHTLDWGFTVQYSLPYLEDFVRYTGLGAPFRNMFPIVEFANETCLDRNCGGQTTGSINPGVIWMGKSTQLAVELNVPVNHRSGSHVGFMLQYHLYLDDIFPSLKR
ncbi:MAG: hypothetical protein KGJ32_06800 [Xanthomonadaceae bacterium]|nr:hypothetical protein [Xanthomonadaceae bacterium]